MFQVRTLASAGSCSAGGATTTHSAGSCSAGGATTSVSAGTSEISVNKVDSHGVSAAVRAATVSAPVSARNDWSRQEIQDIYDSPLMDLMFHGVSGDHVSCFMFHLWLHLDLIVFFL